MIQVELRRLSPSNSPIGRQSLICNLADFCPGCGVFSDARWCPLQDMFTNRESVGNLSKTLLGRVAGTHAETEGSAQGISTAPQAFCVGRTRGGSKDARDGELRA